MITRTKKFETRLQLNSNFQNYDFELQKYFKNIITHVGKGDYTLAYEHKISKLIK